LIALFKVPLLPIPSITSQTSRAFHLYKYPQFPFPNPNLIIFPLHFLCYTSHPLQNTKSQQQKQLIRSAPQTFLTFLASDFRKFVYEHF
jgi:hypothetical protein